MEIIDWRFILYNWTVHWNFLLLNLLVILLLFTKICELIHYLLKLFFVHRNFLVVFRWIYLIDIHFFIEKLFWNLRLHHLIHSNFIFLIERLDRALHLSFHLILVVINIQIYIFLYVQCLNPLRHIGLFIDFDLFLRNLSLWNFETIVKIGSLIILFLIIVFLAIELTLLSLNTWSSWNLIY